MKNLLIAFEMFNHANCLFWSEGKMFVHCPNKMHLAKLLCQ